MTKRMLIDATHEEETRVAVLDGNRLAEFDYESKYRKALKGSIFLAKVTRVEPSLQAAFVNFGGNRHGFLPFSEIHPDYFRIPIADREALIAEQEAELAAQAQEEEELDALDAQDGAQGSADQDGGNVIDLSPAYEDDDAPVELAGDLGGSIKSEDDAEPEDDVSGNLKDEQADFHDDDMDQDEEAAPGNRRDDGAHELDAEFEDEEGADDVSGNVRDGNGEDDQSRNEGRRGRRDRFRRGRRGGRGGGRDGRRMAHGSKRVEAYDDENGGDRFRFSLRRKYKIQEVIKRGQIMLVQVSKEERGNKGAAVTTYLSLPGRYCVLMPNSPRGGGVSRKIANHKDRARMREMMRELEVPKGMSVILRTAGMSRTKTEIKRDLDYLMRLWDNIRELTLQSTAPAMVYEEADLIKRAVRDLYSRDIDEIWVAGEEGYKNAKNFMKMMIPSHAKRVQQYPDNQAVPLFHHYKAERHIAEIGETQVTLPSGGYLVINPTEALVSIDVNSGRATKERHIEETALKTNLEAADEVARQLRLRDLGGLIVVDFIDMEDRRNNAKVERRMREALSSDRARIQVGRISSFGLLEMSRQRMNPSLNESQFESCSHCHGTGRIRTADATAVMVLRAIEDEGIKGRAAQVIAHVPTPVAIYLLNSKRKILSDIEGRYGFTVLIRADDAVGASSYRVEVSRPSQKQEADSDDGDGAEDDGSTSRQDNRERPRDEDRDNGREGGRRRRGRRGGRNRRGRSDDSDFRAPREDSEDDAERDETAFDENSDFDEAERDDSQTDAQENDRTDDSDDGEGRKSRSRGRRGGRNRRGRGEGRDREDADSRSLLEQDAEPEHAASDVADADEPAQPEQAAPKAEAPRAARPKAAPAEPRERVAAAYEVVNEPPQSKKKGWWNKLTD